MKRRGSGGSRGFWGAIGKVSVLQVETLFRDLAGQDATGHWTNAEIFTARHIPKNLCFLRYLCVSRFWVLVLVLFLFLFSEKKMRVTLGSDHAGFELKQI